MIWAVPWFCWWGNSQNSRTWFIKCLDLDQSFSQEYFPLGHAHGTLQLVFVGLNQRQPCYRHLSVFLLRNIQSCCTLLLLWSAVRTLKPDLVFPWSQQNVWQESFPGTMSTSPYLPVTRWAAWGKQSHTTGELSQRDFRLTVLSALSCRLGTLSWSRRMRPFPVTWSSFPATGETGHATSPPPAWTENPAIK